MSVIVSGMLGPFAILRNTISSYFQRVFELLFQRGAVFSLNHLDYVNRTVLGI